MYTGTILTVIGRQVCQQPVDADPFIRSDGGKEARLLGPRHAHILSSKHSHLPGELLTDVQSMGPG